MCMVSLLPKYRGAAPIAWAILNNERETGVSIMKMAAGLDTGDVLSQRATPIDLDETAADLHDCLATIGAVVVCRHGSRRLSGAINQAAAARQFSRNLRQKNYQGRRAAGLVAARAGFAQSPARLYAVAGGVCNLD